MVSMLKKSNARSEQPMSTPKAVWRWMSRSSTANPNALSTSGWPQPGQKRCGLDSSRTHFGKGSSTPRASMSSGMRQQVDDFLDGNPDGRTEVFDDRRGGMAVQRVAAEPGQLIDCGFDDENAPCTLRGQAQRLVGEWSQRDGTEEPRRAARRIDGTLRGFGDDAMRDDERLRAGVTVRLVLPDLGG